MCLHWQIKKLSFTLSILEGATHNPIPTDNPEEGNARHMVVAVLIHILPNNPARIPSTFFLLQLCHISPSDSAHIKIYFINDVFCYTGGKVHVVRLSHLPMWSLRQAVRSDRAPPPSSMAVRHSSYQRNCLLLPLLALVCLLGKC